MILRQANNSWKLVRWTSAALCLALGAMIGCFDAAGGAAGGGCVGTGSGGNDNVTVNENAGGGNENVNANDNLPSNDNIGGNANLNSNVNQNGNTSSGNTNANQNANDNVNTNNNTGGNVNQNSNTSGNTNSNANTNANANANSNSNANVNNNSGGGGGGTVHTRGDAVQPGETAILSLDQDEAACFTNTQWVQTSPTSPILELTPLPMNENGGVSFTAPAVTTTTNFTFTVTVPAGCSTRGTTGTAIVEVQVANAMWDQDGIDALPDCIELGCSIDLDLFFDVTNQPALSVMLYSVDDLDDTSIVTINQLTGLLTLCNTAGCTDGVTSLTVRGQVFGTAGLLDETTDTISIVTNCSTCP